MKYKEDLINPDFFQNPLEINGFSDEDLISFLEKMLFIRLVENKLALEKRNNVIKGPVHLGVGQEAIPVAVSHFLREKDKVFGAHRSHGHLLSMNPNSKKFFSEILGKETGFCRGNGGSMHLWDEPSGFLGSVPIVAGTVPLAVGAAMSSKLKKDNSVSISYLGDGAVEEGVVHESMNLAKVQNLPVIFIVENNLFASHMDISLRQPNTFTSRFAEANQIENYLEDGNDVVSICKVIETLIENARKNNAPGFLELINYRWYGHVDWREDIDVGIKRSRKELDSWKKRDPIARLKKAMIDKKIFSNDKYNEILKKIELNIEEGWSFAVQSPYPDVNDLKRGVYAFKSNDE